MIATNDGWNQVKGSKGKYGIQKNTQKEKIDAETNNQFEVLDDEEQEDTLKEQNDKQKNEAIPSAKEWIKEKFNKISD